MSGSIRKALPLLAGLLVASAVPLLTPTKAEAWWVRGGCCWGGVVVAPPIVVAPAPVYAPPVVYAPAPYYPPHRVWVPGHYRRDGFWVPPHWE